MIVLRRLATAVLVAALLAPVVEAGAVLADDLRDMAAGSTGLADDPDTPGPDLYAPRVWGTDIPDMPSLVVLDAPASSATLSFHLPLTEPCAEAPVSAAHLSTSREIAARGPPLRTS